MATTTNYGWTTPDDTDLVKDGAAAIRTLGSSVDTTTKNLNPETTTGDIAYRSATANTNTRLALGTAGQVLTVNSGATAPEWATPAGGGGKVLQVVQGTYSTSKTVSTNTFTDTDLSLSITPTASNSKVLVIISQPTYVFGTDNGSSTRLLRGSTEIWSTGTNGYEAVYYGGATQLRVLTPIVYLDSPATTSSTTYKTQGKTYSTGGGIGVEYQNTSATSTITLMEIGA